MKNIILFLLILFAFTCLQAQNKQYDIFSYTAPAGFKLKEQKQRLFFEKTEGNSFCQLYLWPAQQGINDPDMKFNSDWDYFAAKPYNLTGAPEKQNEKQSGWDVVTGVSPVTREGLSFIVTVSTFTQNSISWCAVTVFNDEKYLALIDQFLMGIKADSKKFIKPTTATVSNNNTIPASNNSFITKSTTTFDDGWTSIITNDFVQVSKNGTEVRLYYVDATIDKQRPSNTNSFEGYYWDAIVKSAFNTTQPSLREKEQYSYGKEDIWEAIVTNKQTGKTGYLGMRLVFNNGACRPIVVIAPDKNIYYSLFGNDDDFTKMLSYNKFAVTQKDLVGRWKSFQASSIGYYSIYTGDYAGMATASTNDEFVFNNNGSYQSTHTGTSSFNGSLAHGNSIYKGIYNVTDWHMTATNRGANDPGEFSCQFEAVKGGYMLRLVNKKFSGDAMTLFKSN